MTNLAKEVEDFKYLPNTDWKPIEDKFDPITLPISDHIRMPQNIDVQFIQHHNDIEKLEVLIGQPFIGVDSEWRPKFNPWHKTKGLAIF